MKAATRTLTWVGRRTGECTLAAASLMMPRTCCLPSSSPRVYISRVMCPSSLARSSARRSSLEKRRKKTKREKSEKNQDNWLEGPGTAPILMNSWRGRGKRLESIESVSSQERSCAGQEELFFDRWAFAHE